MPTTTLYPPTGTFTFLFTDIEGSSRPWEQDPDAMRPALARHDLLLRSAVEHYHGHIVKTTGDGVHAAFATAPEALLAALSAQRALRDEPWNPRATLTVRMGLYTGMAEKRDGDYYGGEVNRAARLMAMAHGGQVLLSAATLELVRDHLPDGAGLRALGAHRLKDQGRPEQVFQLLHPALPADFPPLRSLDSLALPNNLPQQPTSFIGREMQIAEIKALLSRTRLLTLTGAGGAGKTRLSLQVAADLLTGDGEGDGVWLVELAPLSDPALVPQAVADVLRIKERAGQPLQRTLMEELKAKRLLLILDNCEHLVSACASLAADLLRACPDVHLLASSREALNVAGEQTYRVPSLSMPDPEQTQSVGSLSQYEAVRLFIERAQAVRPAFIVTDANAPAVAQICRRLDGIPLALEMAAARIRSLSVQEINVRMDHLFCLLTGGTRTALPRQQTLRALITWSYDLLTEQEKTLLRRLSVFAGGCDLAAAEGVCSGDGFEDFEVMDLLMGLVNKSLVVYEEGEGDVGRYRLLETVRQYAGDRLQESGEADAVQDRAASWFLGLAEEAEPHLKGAGQSLWLRRLDAEYDNLRASLLRDEQVSERSADGTEAGLRLAGALYHFWWLRGHYSEGRLRLDRALARTGTEGQNGAAGKRVAMAKAKALDGAGHLAFEQGASAAARALYEESLTIQRQMGDLINSGWALAGLGRIVFLQGDYVEARALFEESLAIRRQARDQWSIAHSLICLGFLTHAQGDSAGARALYEESLTIQRQVEDLIGIGWSLAGLGDVAFHQGDYVEARALFSESLTILRRQGDQRGTAYTLKSLGDVASCQGDFAEARALFSESLAIVRRLADPRGVADSLEGMAGIAYRQSRPSRAVHLLAAASSLRGNVGIPRAPAYSVGIEKWMSSAREALGEDAFAAAWDAGRAMTWEQAVEHALSTAGGDPA